MVGAIVFSSGLAVAQGLNWDEAFALNMGFLFGVRRVVTRVLFLQSIWMNRLLTLSVLSSKLASACRARLFVEVRTLTAFSFGNRPTVPCEFRS